ncbi:MAG: hypothetical protein IKR42_05650 [Campylobacter sp.]|nr:hypothetical protein [Campylobacter sp.]
MVWSEFFRNQTDLQIYTNDLQIFCVKLKNFYTPFKKLYNGIITHFKF